MERIEIGDSGEAEEVKLSVGVLTACLSDRQAQSGLTTNLAQILEFLVKSPFDRPLRPALC